MLVQKVMEIWQQNLGFTLLLMKHAIPQPWNIYFNQN